MKEVFALFCIARRSRVHRWLGDRGESMSRFKQLCVCGPMNCELQIRVGVKQ